VLEEVKIEIILWWLFLLLYLGELSYQQWEIYQIEKKHEGNLKDFFQWWLGNFFYKKGKDNLNRGKKNRALKYLKQAVNFNPSHKEAVLELVALLIEKGLIYQAEEMIKAIDGSEFQYQKLLYLSMINKSKGEWQEALKNLQLALELGGDTYSTHILLAEVYAGLHNVERAIHHYKKALSFVNSESELREFITSFLNTFKGISPQVIENFLLKNQIDLSRAEVNNLMHRSFKGLYSQTNKYQFSPIEKIAILLIAFPSEECRYTLQYLPSTFIKHLVEVMGCFTEVPVQTTKEVFKEFLEVCDWIQVFMNRAKEARRHYKLASAFISNGNIELGIFQLNKALKINPNYIEARKLLGLALAKKGELAEAINEWESLINIGVKDPELHKNLGDAYARLGKLKSASREWKKASIMEKSNG